MLFAVLPNSFEWHNFCFAKTENHALELPKTLHIKFIINAYCLRLWLHLDFTELPFGELRFYLYLCIYLPTHSLNLIDRFQNITNYFVLFCIFLNYFLNSLNKLSGANSMTLSIYCTKINYVKVKMNKNITFFIYWILIHSNYEDDLKNPLHLTIYYPAMWYVRGVSILTCYIPSIYIALDSECTCECLRFNRKSIRVRFLSQLHIQLLFRYSWCCCHCKMLWGSTDIHAIYWYHVNKWFLALSSDDEYATDCLRPT